MAISTAPHLPGIARLSGRVDLLTRPVAAARAAAVATGASGDKLAHGMYLTRGSAGG